jgi:FMN phosphatase YigB (HAD superfamily)
LHEAARLIGADKLKNTLRSSNSGQSITFMSPSQLAKISIRSSAPVKARIKEFIWRRLYREFSIDKTIHTVSFDAFDTLMTRPWFQPSDQFAAITSELREQGLFCGTELEWMTTRQACENEARLREAAEEISLRKIYEMIGKRLDWSPAQADWACDAELRREMNDIRPIAPAIGQMKRIAATGKEIIVVSDTYFSGTQLAELLRRCGCDLQPTHIFASSDYGLTKRTGRLFKRILDDRKLSPSQFCHVGDQPVADGRAPANLGIRGTVTDAYAPNRYERLLSWSNNDDYLACSAIAGCARASRLSRTFDNSDDQVVWGVGSDVAGPLLLAYVLWVLSRARSKHIDRIYFLARDGEILLQIARKVCQWLGWTIDCRYLYASRQSFAFPAVVEIDESSLHWVVDWSESPTLRVILKRVALNPSEIQEELSRAGFSLPDWDRNLSAADVKKLMEVLKEPQIRQRILDVARRRREVLVAYLRQEGLADGTRWALCDIGWRGLIQASLDRVMGAYPEFPKDYRGFYFGLNTNALLIEPNRADAFHSVNMSWASWIVDIFCAAKHGSVIRFEAGPSGTIVPVLAELENANACRTSTQQAAIMGFVDELTRTLDPNWVSPARLLDILRPRTLKTLQVMLRRPSRDEAEAYGSFEIQVGTTHDSKIEIAPVLPTGSLLRWLLMRDQTNCPWIYWPEAAILRSVRSKSLQIAFHLIERSRVRAASIKASLRLC